MPWVSRVRLDTFKALKDEVVAIKDAELVRAHDQIRRQQDRIGILEQHNISIDRKHHGLPEVPRERVKEQDPMPGEVRDYLENAFGSPEMRANLEDDIAMARSQGTPWSEIMKVIELEAEDVQPQAD